MLIPSNNVRIYLFAGHTDMRKGANGLALLISPLLREESTIGSNNEETNKGEIKVKADIDDIKKSSSSNKMFVFRGKSADKIKVLWWDGQGFCLFYKCFDQGRFIWPSTTDDNSPKFITSAQLSMLLEGVDWRRPKWTKPPEYVG